MPEISYRFRSTGASNVIRDVTGLAAANRALAESEGRLRNARGRSVGARARGDEDAHVRARIQHQKDESRATDRAERDKAKSAEKAEKERARNAEKASRERLTQERKAQSDIDRLWKARVREQDRIHADEQRSHARSLAAKSRAEAKHAADMKRRTEAAKRRSARDELDDGVLGTVGSLASGAALTAMASMAAVSAAAYRQRGEREQAARDLATSGGARNSFRTLLGDAEADAVAVRGTKVTDLLQGQAQYVAMTGDLAGARANARTMATAARGTGASESAIAATMATFSTKFGISSPEQMQAALGIMNASGKAGAFEMGDAARYFQEMGAAGSRFGLDKGVAGVSKLTAMAQIARMSTGSGAEASTGVQAMLRQLTAKSADIKAMNKGKEVVFADKGKTKTNDIVDVLVGTLRASKGNQVKLTKVFGDEGMKGASEFIKRFNEAGAALGPAATEAQKLAAGEQAVRDAFTQLSGAAGTWSDVVADAATRTDTASARLTTAWEEAVTKVGSAVAPGVNELSKHFDVLIGPLTSMAQEVGTTTGSLANLVAYLKRYGLIGPDPSAAGDDPGAKINRLAAVDKRLAELDKPDAKLTTKQQAEKRALLTEQRDLRIETGVDDVHARLNAKYDRKLGQTPTQKLYDTSDPLGIFAGSPDRDVSQLQSQDQIAPQRGLLGELWETNMAPVRAFQALGGAAGTSNANADAGARAFEGSNRGLQEAARALIEAAGELKTGVRTGVPDPAGGLGGRPYP